MASFDCSFLQALDLSADQVAFGGSSLHAHATDYGTSEGDGTEPDAVVWPESTADVADVLAAADDRGVPVTPYAAGTGLEGGAVPVGAGISLDLTRLNSVVDVSPDDLLIEVEAGVLGATITETVRPEGLFFPPLPSSGESATVGGMIATDASGMQTVKYGEVHDWVRSVEAVLADGSVVTAGTTAPKTSSGYNLKDLLVGSEGTLAVVTRATVELAGLPAQTRGGRVVFPSVSAATDAVADAIRSGLDVAALELMDDVSARMANRYFDTDLPNEPMLFFECHANHGVERELEFARTIFEAHDADAIELADDEAELEEYWALRRDLSFAIGAYDPSLESLSAGDVAVPTSRYSDLLEFVQSLEDDHGLLIPCFGHAGDGNLHYSVMGDPSSESDRDLATSTTDRIVQRALSLDGTTTGEHGIGRQKRRYLRSEHGDRELELMSGIKRTFDPNGILNPGKALPNERRSE
jgi:D-lactate dehydrogenase (cytochrome)